MTTTNSLLPNELLTRPVVHDQELRQGWTQRSQYEEFVQDRDAFTQDRVTLGMLRDWRHRPRSQGTQTKKPNSTSPAATPREIGLAAQIDQLEAVLREERMDAARELGNWHDASCVAAFERLRELSRFAEDWNGDGGHLPSAVALVTAGQVIVEVAHRLGGLLGSGATPYTVMPVADGGIVVEWRADRISAHIDVTGDGRLGYLIDDRRGPERKFEEANDLAVNAAAPLVERALRS